MWKLAWFEQEAEKRVSCKMVSRIQTSTGNCCWCAITQYVWLCRIRLLARDIKFWPCLSKSLMPVSLWGQIKRHRQGSISDASCEKWSSLSGNWSRKWKKRIKCFQLSDWVLTNTCECGISAANKNSICVSPPSPPALHRSPQFWAIKLTFCRQNVPPFGLNGLFWLCFTGPAGIFDWICNFRSVCNSVGGGSIY